MQRVILASASPRRRQLLEQIGLEFQCIPAEVDEDAITASSPRETAEKLARVKAEAVACRFEHGIVISADTIVVLDSMIMGKPFDRTDAFQKLQMLSNREHQVMTGLCVYNCQTQKYMSEVEVTNVFFRYVSPLEINAYLDSGEWRDKAGGYGIQGLGALLVEKIEGCYFNVVGLPLNRLNQMLCKQGVYILGRETPGGLQGWD